MRIAPAEHADDQRSVYTNDRESCASMTEQLAALGHTRIGFIIGNPDHAAVADRYQGYLDGLRKCGLDARQEAGRAGLQLLRLGRASARASSCRCRTAKRPTAIFASNDEMAAGVLAVAHGLGLADSRRSLRGGFDDVPLASQVWPALTTIRQPIPAMAAQAAELLLTPVARRA